MTVLDEKGHPLVTPKGASQGNDPGPMSEPSAEIVAAAEVEIEESDRPRGGLAVGAFGPESEND